MKKNYFTYATLLITALFVLFAGICQVHADAQSGVEYEFAFAVHSISSNQYIRHVGPDASADVLGHDEYYAVYMTIHNNSGQSLVFSKATILVDKEAYSYGGATIQNGRAYSLYLDYNAAKEITAGKHSFTLKLEDKPVYSKTFNMPGNWGSVMNLPSADQVRNHKATGRAPYIVCTPSFSGTDGYTDYAVDFRADYLPVGTYLATCNFDIDNSSLLKQYASVSRDYYGVGAYCGFQKAYDGSGIAIMTVWDTYCTDRQGNTHIIKATGIKAAGAEFERNKDQREGSFLHCLVPYDWKEGRDYRAVVKLYGSRLQFWVEDLTTQSWTQLMEFDLGYDGGYIKSACAFLEDFSFFSYDHAAIRTMSLSNFRVRDRRTGKWIGAKTASFRQDYDYRGSYNYGAQGNTFWAITSNIEGLCRKPEQDMRCTVDAYDSEAPY